MFQFLFQPYPDTAAPQLLPTAAQMRADGVADLESWFGGGREWLAMLQLLGGMKHDSWVLEIGPGYGQTTFALRRLLTSNGSYDGVESSPAKFRFLEHAFAHVLPYMRFNFADIRSAENPGGSTRLDKFMLPFPHQTHDVVFSGSSFARMFPDDVGQMMKEMARVMKPGARALMGVHLLDNVRSERQRPDPFASDAFAFNKLYRTHVADFRMGGSDGKLRWTAYQLSLLMKLAAEAGLELPQPPLPGRWSGARNAVTDRDVLILRKPDGPRLPENRFTTKD